MTSFFVDSWNEIEELRNSTRKEWNQNRGKGKKFPLGKEEVLSILVIKMIQKKIQLSWKNVSLFSFCLIGISWLGFSLWNYLNNTKDDPWKRSADSPARVIAEKQGKMILFLIEPKDCFDCKEIRIILEDLPELKNRFIFDSIGEKEDPSRFEAISLDDRYSDELEALSQGAGIWGLKNVSDEILFLKKGVPGIKEGTILLELAQKNQFRSKEESSESRSRP
ncbi:hypothetical protein CH380_12790 [Leptospira adleri]|uniref:Uncharacterized protein n=2 Tax=Leptospira adleri TaxID=2023186 RepID=A0A2M9YN25_9LEPT|nr:hypothetical protein CH380_12790 [Leptospira adleri]PJZ61371.1 hypothetical protein CH376_13810 [Leptospira adleri]